MSYNAPANRTSRIDGTVQIDGMTAQFVQGMEITMDANIFQRDHIGTGTSIFSQNGDVVGNFSFRLKNTTDLYDTSTVPIKEETLSLWMAAISGISPAKINFIQTFKAPNGSTSTANFARVKFTGRIMKPAVTLDVNDALQDVTVEGEITTFTSAIRESS